MFFNLHLFFPSLSFVTCTIIPNLAPLHLPNFILPMTPCRQKIISMKFLSENLPHTNNVPIEVIKMQRTLPKIKATPTKLSMSNIFQDRMWNCINVVIYYNYYDKKQISDSHYSIDLVSNFRSHVGYKDDLVSDHMYHFTRPTHDHFSILVIPDVPEEKFWQHWKSFVSQRPPIYTNFKVLFLPNKLCIHAKLNTAPKQVHFICNNKFQNPNLIFPPLSPVFEPCWKLRDRGFEQKHAIKNLLSSILNLRPNLSRTFDPSCLPQYQDEDHDYVPQLTVGLQVGIIDKIWNPLKTLQFTEESFNYISCYREETIVYSMYLTPFDATSWAMVVTSLLVISLVVDLFVRFYLKITSAPSSLLFFLGSIIEEPSSPPSSGVAANPHFRLASIWYLFASVVLSNGYISFLITNLNAPFPPKIFDTIESLHCGPYKQNVTFGGINALYKNFIGRSRGNIFQQNNATLFRREHERSPCFSILSNKTELGPMFPMSFYELGNYVNIFYSNKKMDEVRMQFSYQFFSQKMRWYPRKLWGVKETLRPAKPIVPHYTEINEYVEDEVVACTKSVFFAEGDRVELQRQKFERLYPRVNFYVGKDPLLKNVIHLILYSSIYSKFPPFLQSVSESGLLQRLLNDTIKEEVRNVVSNVKKIRAKNPQRYRTRENSKVKPQSFESSVVTIFIILGLLLSIAIVCFLLEVGPRNLKNLYKFLLLKSPRYLKRKQRKIKPQGSQV